VPVLRHLVHQLYGRPVAARHLCAVQVLDRQQLRCVEPQGEVESKVYKQFKEFVEFVE